MSCRAVDISTISRRLPGVMVWWHHSKSLCSKTCWVQMLYSKRIRTCLWNPITSISAAFKDQSVEQTSVSFADSRAKFEAEKRLLNNSAVLPSTPGDTIAAIVTPVGGQQGAVEIIRLSGPSAVAIVKTLFVPARRLKCAKSRSLWNPASHMVEYGTLIDASGALIDEVLVVPMFAPRSYTREDVIEIQCHGGGICSRRVLQVCLEAGARLAQPGEFTLRAFLNGRLDLSQAENVHQLVSAKTLSAAETALAGLQGGLSLLVQSLRMECIEMLADIDARLDFEDDLPDLDISLLVQKIEAMRQKVQQALKTEKRGRLLQTGIQVAIIGRPNVGKSSLLNAWSQVD